MPVRLTTTSDELIGRIRALEGRWNAVAWNGHDAGTVVVTRVTVQARPDGTRDVTAELAEAAKLPAAPEADFAELGDLTPM